MRRLQLLPIAAAVAVVALSASAGVTRRRAVLGPLPAKDALSITFSRPLVDFGTIAHSGSCDWRVTRTSEEVGVRIDGRPAQSARAVLRASLLNADARCVVRIDGITLGPLSIVIDGSAVLGATTTHRIEIEVPASAPEGSLMTTISWEAQ
jgi:hypothetical protein